MARNLQLRQLTVLIAGMSKQEFGSVLYKGYVTSLPSPSLPPAKIKSAKGAHSEKVSN